VQDEEMRSHFAAEREEMRSSVRGGGDAIPYGIATLHAPDRMASPNKLQKPFLLKIG
jgi:hypothetical protein